MKTYWLLKFLRFVSITMLHVGMGIVVYTRSTPIQVPIIPSSGINPTVMRYETQYNYSLMNIGAILILIAIVALIYSIIAINIEVKRLMESSGKNY